MTDWPDEWFRTGGAGAGAAGAGGQSRAGGAASPGAGAWAGGAASPGAGAWGGAGAEPPTTGSPGFGYGSQDQPTHSAASPPSQRSGSPYGGSPGSAWRAQPARYARGRGSGGSGRPPRRTGWRRWLRPRPIALALAVIVS